MSSDQRLIVVSNRLPYVVEKQNGELAIKAGSGGLITAMIPVLQDRGGLWIGWSGTTIDSPDIERLFSEASEEAGYRLVPVALSQEEIDKYYHGYSNETLWPLFHDLQTRCEFDPDYWHTYVKVNRRFADTLLEHIRKDDFVWIHDYQLIDVAHHLRDSGNESRLAFFLHIPFPSPDIFMKLPEQQAILDSLLAYDLVGFQTPRDRRNFLQCVRTLMKGTRVKASRHLHTVTTEDREMQAGVFPIGIDAADFATRAALPETEDMLGTIRTKYAGQQIVLGLDRLDYTKGIPERLWAFGDLLERFPEVRGKIKLIQVVIPSRGGITEYDDLRMQIERLVGEINGRYSQMGWVPIHYFYRSLTQAELLGSYRAADIALITPLKDGMNLVAKEFCACSLEEDAVLILSQFAGAAVQLGKCSVVVNPYDVEQTADAIYNAFRMPSGERRYHMRRLRRNVRTQDVYWWVEKFIQAATDQGLRDYPVLRDYIPQQNGVS